MHNACQLTFVTPQSEYELAPYMTELLWLFRFVPCELTEDQMKAWLYSNVPNVTITYSNGVLIGAFIMEVYAKTVELHGVVRPDLRSILPRANRFKLYIYSIIFDCIFNKMGRDKVIIKAPSTNRDVFGFAVAHGFKSLRYKDKGETVYVLTREEYTRRTYYGKGRKPESKSEYGQIGFQGDR